MHNDIVALRGYARLGEQVQKLGLSTGLPIKIVRRGIFVAVDLNLSGYFDDVLIQGKEAAGIVQPDSYLGKVRILAALTPVNKIGQPFCAHGPRAGEAESEEQGIDDI